MNLNLSTKFSQSPFKNCIKEKPNLCDTMSRTVGPPKPRKSNEVVDTVITYFKHWLDNKGRTNRKLAVFIDGSAVRGCYHGNDCGLSLAITAYKVALEHQILSPQDRPEVNMVFTDCDAQNLHNLFYFLRQVRKEFSSVFNYGMFCNTFWRI